MKFINRCVVSLKPRQPFIDWATRLGVDLPEDWSLEGGAYLLDEQETEEDLLRVLEQSARDMMENELSAWEEDRSRCLPTVICNSCGNGFTCILPLPALILVVSL